MKEKHRDKSKNKNRKQILSSKKRDPLLNEIFFEKYKTIKKLGEGSFGKVYKAEYNGEFYAIKFESRQRPKSLLENEAIIMAYLQGPNIPFIKSSGYSGDYNLLVMQLMDKSLEDIIHVRKMFSTKTTAMIGFQLIGILHFIHDKNIIHRDVKPDNCVMGSGELNENLYLIDFGLAKKYRSSRTLKQYPLTRKKRLTGTARYASIHALEGYEQSRRDDMESVGYIMAYLLRGGLPWQGLKLKSKEDKYKNILEKKKEISSQELFKGFPNEFSEILDYTKKLDYLQEPEYETLRNKLMALCKRLNYSFDFIYDWTTEKDLIKRKNKKNFTSHKTQSTSLSTKNGIISKKPKKEKFVEKCPDDLLEQPQKFNNKEIEKDISKDKNKEKEKENVEVKEKEREKELRKEIDKENEKEEEKGKEIDEDKEKKEEKEEKEEKEKDKINYKEKEKSKNKEKEKDKEKDKEDKIKKDKEKKDEKKKIKNKKKENKHDKNENKEKKDINTKEEKKHSKSKKDKDKKEKNNEKKNIKNEDEKINKNNENIIYEEDEKKENNDNQSDEKVKINNEINGKENEEKKSQSNKKDNSSNNEENEKDEDNKSNNKINDEDEKESSKSDKTDSFENDNENKENSMKNSSNEAEIDDEDIEPPEKTVCCIM